MHFINMTSNYFQRLGKTKPEFKNFIKWLIREKSTHTRDLICVLHAAVPGILNSLDLGTPNLNIWPHSAFSKSPMFLMTPSRWCPHISHKPSQSNKWQKENPPNPEIMCLRRTLNVLKQRKGANNVCYGHQDTSNVSTEQRWRRKLEVACPTWFTLTPVWKGTLMVTWWQEWNRSISSRKTWFLLSYDSTCQKKATD